MGILKVQVYLLSTLELDFHKAEFRVGIFNVVFVFFLKERTWGHASYFDTEVTEWPP